MWGKPPLPEILQARHPGLYFLKIITWSQCMLTKQEGEQMTCFGG